MEWENKLKELNEYNVAFEIRQGYYHISIVFQDGWDVILPDNKNIYLEKRNGIHHYIASTETISINEMFDCIDNTIQYNKDLERKLILFKEKTKELQDIFSKEDYEKLKTIEFTFPKQKKKQKKMKIEKTNTTNVETIDASLTTVSEIQINDEEEIVTMKEGEYVEELDK